MLDEEGFKGTEQGGLAPRARAVRARSPAPRLGRRGRVPACAWLPRNMPMPSPRRLRRGCTGLPGRGSPGVAALAPTAPPGQSCPASWHQSRAEQSPVPARSPGAPGRAQRPPGMPGGSAPDSDSSPVIIPVSDFIPPLRPLRASWGFWQRRARHRPSQAGRGEPCPAAGSGFWGVLGWFDPFQASPCPSHVPFGDVPTAGDPARAVHHPQPVLPGVPAQRAEPEGPDPGPLPTPKPSCPGRRSRAQRILGRDPRNKGQRSGRGHSQPGRRLTSFCCGTGARPRLSPLPEPELFPMYCFISGPADKCSSIPRGGREVLNNGPVSPRPRSAL